MKLRHLAVPAAVFALALPLAAQMGMGMGRVPTLGGIFRPVVGTGSVYETTEQNIKRTIDFAVIGKEDMNGKTGYWVEMSFSDPKSGGEFIVKVLETVEGDTITYAKEVFQMPGREPMEMDPSMMRQFAPTTDSDYRKNAELVGSETVTVPAGTFTCEHYRKKDGTGDAWISDKVSPWSLVKMQDQLRTTVLAKTITDAKDRITGTPVKFDPMQMMRNGMGKQPQ